MVPDESWAHQAKSYRCKKAVSENTRECVSTRFAEESAAGAYFTVRKDCRFRANRLETCSRASGGQRSGFSPPMFCNDRGKSTATYRELDPTSLQERARA